MEALGRCAPAYCCHGDPAADAFPARSARHLPNRAQSDPFQPLCPLKAVPPMSGKLTTTKLMLLGLTVGLVPCVASAIDMPANSLSEQVDATHLGEVQGGATSRIETNWTVPGGAYADRDKAEAQLAKLASDRPNELGYATRLVTPLNWDDVHTLYRARFTGLTLEAASALCASLNGIGQACF